MAQLTWIRRLKVSADVDVVASGGIDDFLRPSALRASDELRHADFQSDVGWLLALHFNKLPGRSLPNLHNRA